MRLLQLSDPHLLADPGGRCRGRTSLTWLRHGLERALARLRERGESPDQLLISGDLCQDESWGGYVQLRLLLEEFWPEPLAPPLLLAGNHDHALRLRAALGGRAVLAPSLVCLGGVELVLLDSHVPGWVGGRLGAAQRAWLEQRLLAGTAPLLVAVHHPPLPIGDPDLDAIGLADGPELLRLLAATPRWRGLVFGHVHQHWQGVAPGRAPVPLLGCPSTLCPFGPVQPCPLGRPADPGGRLLELTSSGEIRHRLLRWSPAESP